MKRALVIGCKGALGSAVSQVFLHKKWEVVGVDVTDGAPSGGAAYTVVPPRCSIVDMQRVYTEAINGRSVDAVINVSGGWAGGSIIDTNLAASADLMLHQSLFSSIAAAHVFAKHGNRGSLLLLTGAAGAASATPGMIAYGVAKSGVHFLCKSVAADPSALPPNACVACILPVTLDTAGNRSAMPNADTSAWTSLSDVSNIVSAWAEGVDRPPSGSLARLITEQGVTKVVI